MHHGHMQQQSLLRQRWKAYTTEVAAAAGAMLLSWCRVLPYLSCACWWILGCVVCLLCVLLAVCRAVLVGSYLTIRRPMRTTPWHTSTSALMASQVNPWLTHQQQSAPSRCTRPTQDAAAVAAMVHQQIQHTSKRCITDHRFYGLSAFGRNLLIHK